MIIMPCLPHLASSPRDQLHHWPTLSISKLKDKPDLDTKLHAAFLTRMKLLQDAE